MATRPAWARLVNAVAILSCWVREKVLLDGGAAWLRAVLRLQAARGPNLTE